MKLLGKYTELFPTGSNPALSLTTLTQNQEIESALTGSEYNPLVRWIVLEGIDGWWAEERKEWTTCPQSTMGDKTDQKVLGLEKGPCKDLIGVPVCPYHWAQPSHQLLCDFIWRSNFVGVEDPEDAIYEIEINIPEYAGRIRNENMVEKQLAPGEIRLAEVLNAVLGSEEEKRSSGVLRGVY
ncbi:unnamed protein product [Rhizoctonia solani]|uniref:Uncharacterized protein n=1 Tax=Rhizoctonia solani TaxID=456999 RepID=A0A8H3GK31_9AGAM|nr:unnamed protein product [Rhizoctonia solani]